MQVFYSPGGVLHTIEKFDDSFVVWDVARREKYEPSIEVYRTLQGTHVPKGTPFVLASTLRREFRKWTVDNSEPESFSHLHTGVPFSLVFLPDGKTLAGGYWSTGEKVMLWDITQPSAQPTCFNLPGREYAVSVSPQGKIYAIGHDEATAEVWHIGNNETQVATFTFPNEGSPFAKQKQQVSTAAFAHKSNLLACGDSKGTLHIWDIQHHIRHTLKAHTGWIETIAFSPNEKLLVSVSHPAYRLWDVESGEAIETLPGRIYAFAFSPCSTLIALGGGKKILLRDINHRETVRVLFPPKDSWWPFALAFSPCGKYLASGATWMLGMGIKKCPVLLWDIASGENIAAFRGHPTDIQCLAFSPDGAILASGGYDGTILLWDVEPYL